MSRSLFVRPVVWFATASMLITIAHEFTHVCVAYVLGVRSTLFNYSGDLDLTPAQAATNIPAIIRVAGPAFCLAVGTLSWLALKRARGSPAELPLLYLSVFGIGTFFGNLMSASFIGDFSSVADALHAPMAARYAATAIGGLSVAAVHFWAGRELIKLAPLHLGKLTGTLAMVALPAVLGTAAVVLVNQPMPAASLNARVAEASFWLFAVLGALVAKGPSHPNDRSLKLHWADIVSATAAVLVVRLMVRGIPFVP